MTAVFTAIVAGLLVMLLLWSATATLVRWQPMLGAWLYAPTVQRAIVMLGVGVAVIGIGQSLSATNNSQINVTTTAPSARAEPTPLPTQFSNQADPYNAIVSESAVTRTLGFARPMLPPSALAIDLKTFPRPDGDNGRGLHWFPNTYQSPTVVTAFVPELVAMRIKWVTFVQGLEDYELEANEYLVRSLLTHGIMPVMRVEARIGAMDLRRFRRVVEKYRGLGVAYIQIYNEPNLKDEWRDEGVGTPQQFASFWLDAAEIVAASHGLTGLAAMSPGGDVDDYDYLRAVLESLGKTRRYDVLRRTWLAVHNYSGGRPSDFVGDDAGYGRYRRYASLSRTVLGVTLPMIGTEGGPQPAERGRPAPADAQTQARWITEAFQSLRTREPYWLAYSPWLIGNAVGGGTDARWEGAAWFKVDRVEPVVEFVKRLL